MFSLDDSGHRAGFASKLANSFGVAVSRPRAVRVAIASGSPGEIFEASSGGMIRRQLLPGCYRLYSYRGEMYDEIRRLAVVLAQAFACNWIGDADFADDGKRRAILSVLRDAVARNDDHDLHLWQPQHGPSAPDPDGQGDRAEARQTGGVPTGGFRACRLRGAALINRCYHGAFEALALPLPGLRQWTATMKASDLERMLMRNPHWHARNSGKTVVLG